MFEKLFEALDNYETRISSCFSFPDHEGLSFKEILLGCCSYLESMRKEKRICNILKAVFVDYLYVKISKVDPFKRYLLIDEPVLDAIEKMINHQGKETELESEDEDEDEDENSNYLKQELNLILYLFQLFLDSNSQFSIDRLSQLVFLKFPKQLCSLNSQSDLRLKEPFLRWSLASGAFTSSSSSSSCRVNKTNLACPPWSLSYKFVLTLRLLSNTPVMYDFEIFDSILELGLAGQPPNSLGLPPTSEGEGEGEREVSSLGWLLLHRIAPRFVLSNLDDDSKSKKMIGLRRSVMGLFRAISDHTFERYLWPLAEDNNVLFNSPCPGLYLIALNRWKDMMLRRVSDNHDDQYLISDTISRHKPPMPDEYEGDERLDEFMISWWLQWLNLVKAFSRYCRPSLFLSKSTMKYLKSFKDWRIDVLL